MHIFGTPNRSCLTLYDVIHYSDVISALGLCVFRRNMRFVGVEILKTFSVYCIDLQNFLNDPRIFRPILRATAS